MIPTRAGNHRKNLRLSLETSLRRLRTDYIDIYWVHMWDRHTPAEETMRALDDQVRAGKILYLGISDTPAWVIAQANTLADWHGWTAFAGLQAPYSLLRRDIERELLPMAEAMGMTVAAWSPLADGILSGKFTRSGHRRAGHPNRPRHPQRPSARYSSPGPGGRRRHRRHALPRSPSPGQGPGHRPFIPSSAPAASTSSSTTSAPPISNFPPRHSAGSTRRTQPGLGFPADFIHETSPWVFGAAALPSTTPTNGSR